MILYSTPSLVQGQVVAADSTSVNLFKLLTAALEARPDQTVIVSESQMAHWCPRLDECDDM